jgi:hypothetical protein
MCWIDTVTEEMGEKGKYVRLTGQFAGRFLTSLETGELSDVAASECILPKLGSDWLKSLCTRVDGPRPSDEASKATGVTWQPKKKGMQAKIQLGLKPPTPGKPSERGYEYTLEVLGLDPEIEDPMAGALAQLGLGEGMALKPRSQAKLAAD